MGCFGNFGNKPSIPSQRKLTKKPGWHTLHHHIPPPHPYYPTSGWALIRKSIEELYDPNMKTVTFRASDLASDGFWICGSGGIKFEGRKERPLWPFLEEGNEVRYTLYRYTYPKESMYGIIYLSLPGVLCGSVDHFGRRSHFLKEIRDTYGFGFPFQDSSGK